MAATSTRTHVSRAEVREDYPLFERLPQGARREDEAIVRIAFRAVFADRGVDRALDRRVFGQTALELAGRDAVCAGVVGQERHAAPPDRGLFEGLGVARDHLGAIPSRRRI
ncbi:hypothetical protein A3731_12915 [Roseovarius sp. HI0049]|nr:hypothetical protein A3731_12915 [Roseovarius sp. HI0049]